MSRLLHLGEILTAYARLRPDNVGARDLARALSYRQWNERACRLAQALLGIGLAKGDRIAVLAYNRVEWLEIYAAAAKAGLVAVPINFRLLGAEIKYIVENCEAGALIVEDDLLETVESVRETLPIAADRYIVLGAKSLRAGYCDYEALLGRAASTEPEVEVAPDDTWTLMYTSGTTGKPKGAIRSHHVSVQHALITALDQNFSPADMGLLVMPLCHSNSLWYATLLAYCGATCVVYNRKSFDPEQVLRTLSEARISFTSLVPTHYIMMQGLPAGTKAKYSADSVDKLLISSAPARKDTKLAVMEQFRNSRLFEGYGSTEAGWVTLLRPNEQIDRLGSIGRELTGSARIRLLGEDGSEVPEGDVGEIHSRTPYTFSGYWKLPEKTAEAFRGGYCSVGDMGRRDAHGYYFLADRKSNMIISGGENIYPSEVENLLGAHPKVKDVAVIGVADAKWGESVHAVIVLHGGQQATAAEILDWCSERVAGYKRPRSISFISEEEMPRTATGKILHRVLRQRHERP